MAQLGEVQKIHSDEKAFEHAVRPFLNKLKNYCSSLEQSVTKGEDLFQVTLLKAWVQWKKDPRKINKAYLYRIASNAWIDGYRMQRIDMDYQADFSLIAGKEKTTFAEIEEAFQILLTELTAKQRVVLILSDVFQYSHKEIADLLDCEEGAVRATLYRARKKLASFDSKTPQSSSYGVNDDEVERYVQAFYNDEPVQFITLYQNEAGIRLLMAYQKDAEASPFGMGVQKVGTYYLMMIHTRDGRVWHIPFYPSERLQYVA